jgi:hypothetical protein
VKYMHILEATYELNKVEKEAGIALSLQGLGCGLHDQCSFPVGQDFFCHNVQTDPRAHPVWQAYTLE